MKTIVALRILAEMQTEDEQLENIIVYSQLLKKDIIDGRMADLNKSVARLSLQIALRMVKTGHAHGKIRTLEVAANMTTLDFLITQVDIQKGTLSPEKQNTTLIMMTFEGWITKIVKQNGMLDGVRKEMKSQIISALE